MKKTFVKLLAISALAFTAVGCQNRNTSSTTEGGTSSSEKEVPSTVFTITPRQNQYTVEVGQTFSVNFTVTCTDAQAIKTLSFTLNNKNASKPSVVSSGKHTSIELKDGISASLYAKKIGTCELVAASTVDPSQSVTVTIEVVEALPGLSETWSSINSLKNYTLDITRKPTNQEFTSHTDWDEDTRVPVKNVKLTDKALLVEKATDVKNDLSYTAAPVFSDDKTGSVLGLATDKEGFGAFLKKGTDGSYSLTDRFVTSQCFLIDGILPGLGDSATSPNDVYLSAFGDENNATVASFGGLQVVNSSWFSAIEKDYSNFYEIDATELEITDSAAITNMAMAKVALWELMDYDSFLEYIKSTSSTTFVDIAKNVNLYVTVNDKNSVTVELDVGSNSAFFAEISNVGTTKVDEGITSFLSNATSTIPDLKKKNPAIHEIYENIHKNDYFLKNTGYLDEEGKVKFEYQTYNYSNYFFQTASDEDIKKYESSTKKSFPRGGYVLVNNEMHEFTYTPATETEAEKVVISEKAEELTVNNQKVTEVTLDSFSAALGTFASCPAFNLETGVLNTFNVDSQNGIIYSSSTLANDYISYFYFGGSTLEEVVKKWGYTVDSKLTYFTPTETSEELEDGTTKKFISSTEVFMGTFNTNYGYPFTIYFQTETNNPAHGAIEAAIKAFPAKQEA